MLFKIDGYLQKKAQAFFDWTSQNFAITNFLVSKLLVHVYIFLLVLNLAFDIQSSSGTAENVFLIFLVLLVVIFYLFVLKELKDTERFFLQEGKLRVSWFSFLLEQRRRVLMISIISILFWGDIILSFIQEHTRVKVSIWTARWLVGVFFIYAMSVLPKTPKKKERKVLATQAG